MAFRKKYEKILPYNPDLLIVPECEHPGKFTDDFYSNVLWIGDSKNKGLGVFSFNDIEISYPLQIKWIFNRRKNIIVIPFTLIISWSHKMELEALKQLLASLDINPDEIEDKRYATAFRILFSIIEKQNEEMEFLKAENQKFRDEINLLKGEQTKPKIRGSKKNEDISSEKERHKRRCL